MSFGPRPELGQQRRALGVPLGGLVGSFAHDDCVRRASSTLPEAARVRSRTVAAGAFALLAVIFVVDALTPQTLVVAILLDVPIVMAALTQSRRLTYALVVAALLADGAAAFVNAAQAGYRWDPIGVGDRLLSMLSIVLVGFLSTAVQERAERVGRLAAQDARARREAALAAAADRVRASLSPELVARAIVREAPRLLDGDAAFWYPSGSGDDARRARPRCDRRRSHRRTASAGDPVAHAPAPPTNARVTIVRALDPVGRLVLDRLGAAQRDRRYRSSTATRCSARIVVTSAPMSRTTPSCKRRAAFAAVAVDALAQARLFAALAERNEALNERQDVIRDLVYALSHDLRTPLTALSMTLRQAADGAYGALPGSYATVLRESLISVDDLSRLAETLLLVARFESGERRIERERGRRGRSWRARSCRSCARWRDARGVALARARRRSPPWREDRAPT